MGKKSETDPPPKKIPQLLGYIGRSGLFLKICETLGEMLSKGMKESGLGNRCTTSTGKKMQDGEAVRANVHPRILCA